MKRIKIWCMTFLAAHWLYGLCLLCIMESVIRSRGFVP